VVLADDWQCSQTGWVKDIHFWGSWKNGMTGQIDHFVLAIAADIPADPPAIPYSRPGTTLWEAEIWDFVPRPIDPPSMEGWYDPFTGEVIWNDHQAYFQYNIFLPESQWFWQEAGTTYWLNISAVLVGPTTAQWGWKSTQNHWNDDAVWAEWYSLNWVDLWEPSIPLTDTFWIQINQFGMLAGGGGSGWNMDGAGPWYFYPNTNWWNQWYYDHPFSYERKKVGRMVFDATSNDGITPGNMTVAVNWTTPAWSPNPEHPPIPPLTPAEELLYIGRRILFQGPVLPGMPQMYTLPFEISEYNPEWVSVDVQGTNFRIGVYEQGTIEHDCIQSLDLAFVITGGEPAVGACCYSDPLGYMSLCVQTTQQDCMNTYQGIYQGDGTVCQGMEGCCLPDGTCVDADALCCLNVLGGIPQGAGSACGVLMACCLSDGTCVMVDELCCDELGGIPQAPGMMCTQPAACCLADGTCVMADPLCCDELGGRSQGPGTVCTQPEACCVGDMCIMVDPLCCDEMGGIPQGPTTVCTVPEACCLAVGVCFMADPLCCDEMGGIRQGPGTACTVPQACCWQDGSCFMVDPLCCDDMGGVPQGPLPRAASRRLAAWRTGLASWPTRSVATRWAEFHEPGLAHSRKAAAYLTGWAATSARTSTRCAVSRWAAYRRVSAISALPQPSLAACKMVLARTLTRSAAVSSAALRQ
jgi:hypothetical protein